MDEKETIKAIQQELQELRLQLTGQYQKIQELQQRLRQIDPTIETAESKQKASGKAVWENFIGLRLIHLVGIIVLVIGLSIGVKYAIDQELISEVARIGLAYAAGITLYVLAVRLKQNYLLFSAILFSGAMASLYFTTYAAFVYYQMLPGTLSFILMVLLTAFTVIKAVAYNRWEIALLGLVGAYGIPFLISQNSDRADLFFLYILIIDAGVLYLHYKKGWKGVGRTALLLTWMLFLGWSAIRFEVRQTEVGVLFGSIFFILFTIATLIRRVLHKEALTREDTFIQLGNNCALYLGSVFILGSAMEESTLATITGCFGLFVGMQAWAYRSQLPEETLLQRIHLVLSFVLIVLFVALEWEGFSVTFIWMLLSVLLFAWGVWQKMVTMRMIAMGLMGLTLLKLIVVDSTRFTTVQKVIAYLSLGVLLLVVSFFYQKFREKLFSDK